MLTEIDKELYEKLLSYKDKKIDPDPATIFDSDTFKTLVDNYVFVENEEDQVSKIKMGLWAQRYSTQHLALTIAPTQACNFACVYCYEKDRPNIYMSEQVQSDILDFIKAKEAKSVSVCWYGGEPLLAKDTIRNLTKGIKEIVGNNKYSAGIVTNGYLLDEMFIDEMSSLDITFVQITIDGNKETHNKRRPHLTNKDSYETIMKNLTSLINKNKDISVSIRVNVDKNNIDDFADVLRAVRLIDKRIGVYPGIVIDATHKQTCFCNSKEIAELYLNLFYKKGIYLPDVAPNVFSGDCMMSRGINSFLIDPVGNLHKCWEHIGHPELAVGNVTNTNGYFTNLNVMARYMKSADYLDNAACAKCICFPICDGGCPQKRIENQMKNAHNDVCCIFKYHMEEMLEIKYLLLKMAAENKLN